MSRDQERCPFSEEEPGEQKRAGNAPTKNRHGRSIRDFGH